MCECRIYSFCDNQNIILVLIVGTHGHKAQMTAKTAAAVLQELMVKMGQTPEYECISQSGPQHLAMFEYKCMAHGVVVTAEGRSKKEAKQEVARLMLAKLSQLGVSVPAPYGGPKILPPPHSAPRPPSPAQPDPGAHSYVALLKELCEEYKLPAVEYELVGDTGPPHLRHFTVKACMGLHERLQTSTTKKAARQLAAKQLYTYLRENLARVTKDFVEEDALVRAHAKAMDRYTELKEEQPWRPDLGQKVADYHLGLITHIEEEKRNEAMPLLRKTSPFLAETLLEQVVSKLGLTLEYSELERDDSPLIVVHISPTSPALAFCGTSRQEAAEEALDHMRLALKPLKDAVKMDVDEMNS